MIEYLLIMVIHSSEGKAHIHELETTRVSTLDECNALGLVKQSAKFELLDGYFCLPVEPLE